MAQHWASYSSLTTHRVCPRRWDYGYRRKLSSLERADQKVELLFGQWWQALRTAEVIERGRSSMKFVPDKIETCDGWEKVPTNGIPTEEVIDSAQRWWRGRSGEVQDEWISRLGEDLPGRLAGAFDIWWREWEEERRHEEPLAVEMKWVRDLPAGRDGVDPDTSLVGYVDEVYLDTRRNLIVVRDNKAHKILGTQTAADDMMDSQLQLYAWGADLIVKSWGLKGVQATAYDRIRSHAPKQPQVTQSGTLSKSVTDYDLRTYYTWAQGPDGEGVPYPGRMKDGSQAGRYLPEESVLAKLKTQAARSVWAQRTLVPLSLATVKAHLQAAVDSAVDIGRTVATVKEGREASRNLGASCRWCDFTKLCRAELVGGSDGVYSLAEMGLREK